MVSSTRQKETTFDSETGMLDTTRAEECNDRIVAVLVEEMKAVAAELFPKHPDPSSLPRMLVLSSIVWMNLGQKISKKIDDVRHEHLLRMRALINK